MPGGPVGRRALLGGAFGGVAALAVAACGNTDSTGGVDQGSSPPKAPPTSARTASATAKASHPASAAQIADRATVPVLCWHQLRDWTPSDTGYARNLLICPPAHFRAQLDALAHDGWNTIGPDQYLAHLTTGAGLPDKPVLLTFDDSQGSQLTEGLPQLLARDMTATFFAMTVVLDKPGWLSRRDLKQLDAKGMTIGAHTWDHHRVDQYTGKDWAVQLQQPRELLAKIVGKPVDHFAYPYGAWDHATLAHVAAAGYRSAYALADRKPDRTAPLLTLRRDLVGSTWTGPALLKHLAGLTA